MQYNEQQLAAIQSNDPYKIIVAPCGSGKTSTLVGVIQRYHLNNPHNHIVAITFTRKAAAELKERLGFITNTEVSTIHSWSLRELNKLGEEYNFKVQLLEDSAIKDILKKLSKIRNKKYLNQFQLFSYVMGNYNVDVDENIIKTYEIIRSDYIKFKLKNKLYDFTDLPNYLYDKLTEYGLTIKTVDALFVDEFQDIDPIQYELFNLVEANQKCYIGDPAQSIYRFRGSLENAFENLTDFTTYNLTINYRSYQEILDYASTLREMGLQAIDASDSVMAGDVDKLFPSPIECIRGTGGNVYVINTIGNCRNLVTNKPQSDVLVIKSLLTNKKTQILCRTNKQVKKLQALGIDNVSTIHQAKGLEYDNIVLISFCCDNLEELNIAYVGATRAKNNLCVIEYEVLLYIICQEDITSNKKLF